MDGQKGMPKSRNMRSKSKNPNNNNLQNNKGMLNAGIVEVKDTTRAHIGNLRRKMVIRLQYMLYMMNQIMP